MFNVETPIDDGMLIYNSLTSGILFLNAEYTEEYFKFKNENKCQRQDLKNTLEKGQMIVDDDIDEVGMIKFFNNHARYDDNILSLTLAPTMNCNFECPYCFEAGFRNTNMTDETEKQLVKFIKNLAKEKKGVGICWYGGEPMLALKRIESITKELWKEKNIKDNFSADIVTNGFYLTREKAILLSSLGVEHCQITLDGPPRIHDTRRVPHNGRPTFYKILNNIKESADVLSINIRVNVDKSNIDSVMEVLDILEENGLKNKVGFYISAVDDIMDDTSNTLCFTDKEFSEEEIKFYKNALKKGHNLINVPSSMFGICGAVSVGSYVVDPLGDLYKCWDEVGRKDFSVGNIWKGPVLNNVMASYMNFEAASDEKCSSCPVLPACLGGCPNQKIRAGVSRCSSIERNSQDVSELLYEIKKGSFVNVN